MKMKGNKEKGKVPKKPVGRGVIVENLQIYAMMLPTLLLILVFCYIPMYGIVIAFQDYVPGASFFGEGVKWVGLKWFEKFITSHYFGRLIKNTLILSGLNLIFGFTAPILFALLLDQIRHTGFKKLVQTTSYMPYFISTVVVVGMVISFIDTNGLITNMLTFFGMERQNYRVSSTAFPWIYTFTNVWKSFGFSSILYCSIISAIDPGLYEAAKLDGANRWKQVWHITLPGLRSVIAINLIMAVGSVLSANSEMILLLYTPATYDVADVVGTYVYRLGILEAQYSYTTAAGLFVAIIGFIFTYIANRISNKLTGFGLW
ncbi:putative multiple-sugar transport system permease YteP [Lachnospiraceae bacterium]|nr:putative multiple-sugar transport system permease YteP [Lachnospiraceae bacterium]